MLCSLSFSIKSISIEPIEDYLGHVRHKSPHGYARVIRRAAGCGLKKRSMSAGLGRYHDYECRNSRLQGHIPQLVFQSICPVTPP